MPSPCSRVRPHRGATAGRLRGLPRSDPALSPLSPGASPGKALGAVVAADLIGTARSGRRRSTLAIGGDLAALWRPGAMVCGVHSVGGAGDQGMLLRMARVSGDVVGMVEAASRRNKGAGAQSPSRQGHLWRRR
jgi:hypothetical protein